jgi:acid phosphatase
MLFYYKTILLATTLWLLGGCTATNTNRCDPHLNGTLWVQTAAEYQATAIQTYRTALRTLPRALKNRKWCAALEQSKPYTSLPPAIIMDVDETILDNIRYQAQRILERSTYTPASWDAWVALKSASSVPEAVRFINHASDLGITVFYITNRACNRRSKDKTAYCPQKNETIENLLKVGIRRVPTQNVLLKDEREGWSSEKSSRRAYVASRYRILMMFGDDLGDFLPGVKQHTTLQKREHLIRKYANYWGKKWFILSNPNYGSWLNILPSPKAASLKGYERDLEQGL